VTDLGDLLFGISEAVRGYIKDAHDIDEGHKKAFDTNFVSFTNLVGELRKDFCPNIRIPKAMTEKLEWCKYVVGKGCCKKCEDKYWDCANKGLATSPV
jgi:hypothetical protein